jgi:periplasmic protein TonB
MLKKVLFIQPLLFAALFVGSQNNKYAIEAMPEGGKENFDQVLQTQLTLPKTILTSNFEVDVTAYFNVDSSGAAADIKFEGQVNNLLRKELSRMLRFMSFNKAQNVYKDPYFLNFKLSSDKYNRFFKQRYKLSPKKNLIADSSYIVYQRADLAPEYYKNGEEGLKEFILANMDYPKLAIEKSVEGTVVINFIVETNGYITHINVAHAVGAGCNEEALRVIKQTRWQPATLNNRLVRYKMSYPITFSLRNITKDNASSSSTIGQ